MATQVITDPVILDSTGQSILSALEDIKDAVQPTNVYLDLPMSIQVSDWTQNGSIYSYTWTNSHITEECAIQVFFGSGSSNITSSVVGFEKVAGGVEFETSVRPSASLPVIVRVVNAKADLVVDNLDATMVGTEAINGVSNVEEALGNVNSRITSLNSNMAKVLQNKQYVSPGGNKAITVPNGSIFCICAEADSSQYFSSRNLLIFGCCVSNEVSLFYTNTVGFTVSKSSNVVTVTNSSTYGAYLSAFTV